MKLFFVLIFMNLLYGGTPTLMKMASGELHPFQIVFWRHTLALLAFLPFFFQTPNRKIEWDDFLRIMIAAFFAFTGASVLQTFGMQYTSATDATFIMAMEPLIIIVFAYFYLREKLDVKMIAGIALALIGFITLSKNNSLPTDTAISRWFGNTLFLFAVIAEGLFPVILKPLLKRYSPLVVAFYCLLCASFYMLPFQNVSTFTNLAHLGISTLVALSYLGLGCSFLACFLWLRCLSRASASFVALSWFIQPLFGCLFAFFLLKESLNADIWIGGTFIFGALLLMTPRRSTYFKQRMTHTEHPPVRLDTFVEILSSINPDDFEKPKYHPVSKIPAGILLDHHRQQHRSRHIYH